MPIARTEFGSGLRVVTERMPGVRSVSLGFWVLAGSRDEAPRISGSSHFLEHLLFKGTETRSAPGHRRAVRRGRRRRERVHRQGVHVLLRARARSRPRDGGRPPRGHAAAQRDPQGRPRRRAPGDPRGDQHARGLARRRRARRVHRGALAEPPARPPDPGHRRDDRERHPGAGEALLPPALRARALRGGGGRQRPARPPRAHARGPHGHRPRARAERHVPVEPACARDSPRGPRAGT